VNDFEKLIQIDSPVRGSGGKSRPPCSCVEKSMGAGVDATGKWVCRL
jgi:hypothetical protein